MIREDELMVFDWVQIVSDAPIMANEYHRIDWIRTCEVGLDNRKIVTYPYIQPIPLTPEILEKNFEKQEVRVMVGTRTHYCIIDDYYQLYISEYTDSIWMVEYKNIEVNFPMCRTLVSYLHELQHALKLCGIEKDIEL